MATLQNDLLSISVTPKGAELASVKQLSDGTEFMWQADPAFWKRHAPVLFPIVGRLKGDSFVYEGKSYTMTQHGFARDREFVLVESGPDFLHFTLLADDATKEKYPFEFALHLRYTLTGNSLRIDYKVENKGETAMPFSVGAHPAFNCPIQAGEGLRDYEVVFEQEEEAARHLIEGGLFTGETSPMLGNADRIQLVEGIFDLDAIVLHDLKSEWVALRSKTSGREVRMSLQGWPYLGIWAKPGAPFVCLEPWQGLADYTTATGDLMEKVGIQVLMPGQTHEAGYTVEFR